jgi:hypothetical protein
MGRVVTETDMVRFCCSANKRRVMEDFPAPEGEAITNITPRLVKSISGAPKACHILMESKSRRKSCLLHVPFTQYAKIDDLSPTIAIGKMF